MNKLVTTLGAGLLAVASLGAGCSKDDAATKNQAKPAPSPTKTAKTETPAAKPAATPAAPAAKPIQMEKNSTKVALDITGMT